MRNLEGFTSELVEAVVAAFPPKLHKQIRAIPFRSDSGLTNIGQALHILNHYFFKVQCRDSYVEHLLMPLDRSVKDADLFQQILHITKLLLPNIAEVAKFCWTELMAALMQQQEAEAEGVLQGLSANFSKNGVFSALAPALPEA